MPERYAGTSIGALIAAARVARRAARRDGASARRPARSAISSASITSGCSSSACARRRSISSSRCASSSMRSRRTSAFARARNTLLVNTVDLERGTHVVWGLPGLEDVYVRDAVYASCALPGFFPPAHVGGRVCVDGGAIDNLPTAIASLGVDAVIAVDVGSSDLGRAQRRHEARLRDDLHARRDDDDARAAALPARARGTGRRCCSSARAWDIATGSSFSHAEEMIEAGYDGDHVRARRARRRARSRAT